MTSLQIGILVVFAIVSIGTLIASCYFIFEWKNNIGWMVQYIEENRKSEAKRHELEAKVSFTAWLIFLIIFIIFLSLILFMVFKYIM